MTRVALTIIAIFQIVLATRLVARLAATSRGRSIERSSNAFPGAVGVIVPVLDEIERLAPCLEGLIAAGPEVAKIIVVDGGSRDGTPELVRSFEKRDPRVELIETIPCDGENGKVHGLVTGLRELETPWVLIIDADVRPRPDLVPALLETAAKERVSILSVATQQVLADRLDQIVHPALLTTLIYRFGIPGHATSDPQRVQANGQCLLIERELLDKVGGFDPYRHVIAEDVALARDVARLGERVGFYESPDLISVEMYAGGRETLRNWSRSLPLVDAADARSVRTDLASLALLQAAPLPLLLIQPDRASLSWRVNAFLLAIRFGVLAGARRAYRNPGGWYWLAPLVALPVVLQVLRNAGKRTFEWRGRLVVQEGE